ncbi:MAG: DUF5131 family protein, partial [Verrucomicrobiota bacterium]
CNLTSGCDGCELWNGIVRICYAGRTQEARLSKTMPAKYGASFFEVRLIPGRMADAADWGDLIGADRPEKPWMNGRPRHIFVSDMSDALSKDVPFEYLRAELIGAVKSKAGLRHVWLWLSKRPKRMAEFSEWLWDEHGEAWPDNLMAMTSVTSQQSARVRIDQLLQVKAKWRGLSCEPLTDLLDLKQWLMPADLPFPKIDWVIAGGASGSQAKPMHPDVPRRLRDDCVAAGVPFFFKQFGEYVGLQDVPATTDRNYKGESIADGMMMLRVGKKNLGRELDGRTWDQMPNIGNRRGIIKVTKSWVPEAKP